MTRISVGDRPEQDSLYPASVKPSPVLSTVGPVGRDTSRLGSGVSEASSGKRPQGRQTTTNGEERGGKGTSESKNQETRKVSSSRPSEE